MGLELLQVSLMAYQASMEMKRFSCEDCSLIERGANKQQKNSPTIITSLNGGCMWNKSGNKHDFCLTIILK